MGKSVLVLGDFIIDRYTILGPHSATSEAYCGKYLACETFDLPGGAGNVACNIAALGSKVTMIAVSGDSPLFIPTHKNITWKLLPDRRDFTVPIKHRFLQGNVTRMRVDYEAPNTIKIHMQDFIRYHIQLSRASTLCISDYNKGGINEAIIETAIKKRTFIIVNPKPNNIYWYSDFIADVIIVNRDEAKQISDHSSLGGYTIADYGINLLRITNAHNVVVTDASNGLYWFTKEGLVKHFAADTSYNFVDAVGAGDTVVATIAARGTINDAVLKEAIKNAAIVCSKLGTSTI